ncbi:MAG: hypothetical protein M3Z36_00045 [Acidobacteriota bacterium]|nr:hypothetical protein [Acidobacteriota bacterium]
MFKFLFPFVLFVLNAYLCRELFRLEYSKFLNSIEAAYISISRYVMSNWGDLTWFNLWYGGIPYQNTYPPLLHWIVAATAQLLRTSPAHAHHIVTALFYCLAPVTLYFLAVRLSGSRLTAFCAGLVYSLIAPSAFLMASVRKDLGTTLGPRRLQTLVMYGDGPHISVLALVPLAVFCLDVAITRRKPIYSVLAAISMAAVALTNWLGAFALALAVTCYLLAYPVRTATWVRACAIGVLAYFFACPWIPPSTIRTIQFNAQSIGGDYTKIYQYLPQYLLYGAVLLLALKYVFQRWRVSSQLQFVLFYAAIMGAIPLCAEWGHIPLVPQPERYHLDLDQAYVLASVCVLSKWIGGSRQLRRGFVAIGFVLLLLGATYSQVGRARRFARDWIQPVDISKTSEYRIANWFERNMNGSRVMTAGSSSYWLNAFSDTPQVGGGFEQGVINWQDRVAPYIILSGENAGLKDADIAVIWMRAFGVQAVAVPDPKSGVDGVSPFRNSHKFDGALELLWRDGEDRIYRVPQRSASLAHVVRRSDIVSRAPIHGVDVQPLVRYVAALEDQRLPLAGMRWTTRHSAEITAHLEADQLISVQESYHVGWRASVNGNARKINADALGFMLIEPNCAGSCVIELNYDGGVEMQVARWVSGLSLATSLIWIGYAHMRTLARSGLF